MTPLRITLAVLGLSAIAWAAPPCRADDNPQGTSLLEDIKRRVPPEWPIDEDSPPAMLVEARLRIAALRFNAAIDRLFDVPATDRRGDAARNRGLDVDAMISWSRRCVEARLDAADRDGDRLSAFGIESARMRKIESLIRERRRQCPTDFSDEDLDKVIVRRLELEYRTLRVKDGR